jgi:hypothetical protein
MSTPTDLYRSKASGLLPISPSIHLLDRGAEEFESDDNALAKKRPKFNVQRRLILPDRIFGKKA